MIMLHDAHDQNFNCLLTSRMLHRQCCMDGSARERAPPCGSCGYCLLLHTNLVVSAALESCIVIKSSICILLSIVWNCAVGIMKFVGFLPQKSNFSCIDKKIFQQVESKNSKEKRMEGHPWASWPLKAQQTEQLANPLAWLFFLWKTNFFTNSMIQQGWWNLHQL